MVHPHKPQSHCRPDVRTTRKSGKSWAIARLVFEVLYSHATEFSRGKVFGHVQNPVATTCDFYQSWVGLTWS